MPFATSRMRVADMHAAASELDLRELRFISLAPAGQIRLEAVLEDV